MSINLEVLKELKKLEEDLASMEDGNLQNHDIKHVVGGSNVGDDFFPADMTKEQYNDACDQLSREEVTYVGGDPNKPQGYISRAGRKVKFRRISGNMCEIVVYLGDDVDGVALTYHNRPYSSILRGSNPYLPTTRRDYCYMCDFDNGHRGLNAYFPPKSMKEEDAKKIKETILTQKYF